MKIKIFHASAGYGHHKVAQVIQKAFLSRGLRSEDVTCEDALDSTPFYFRRLYPAIYFYSVKYAPRLWGWFYENLDRPAISHLVAPWRTLHNLYMGRKLLRRIMIDQPDIIICTHFFSAELFATAKRQGKIRSKIMIVITDFFPHAVWVNEGTDFYWGMSEETRQNLIRRGVPKEKIMAGGIPVDSSFQPSGRKTEILKKWGFSSERFTILLTSGSFGLGPQLEILKALDTFSSRIQCFAVCGNNQSLKISLEQESFSFPLKIFGFIDFMPDLMEASDLMIAKSGGSTTTESFAKGIPMVVLEPIPGQEMRNAQLLKDRDASYFMKQPFQIKVILQSILDRPEMHQQKMKSVQGLARPHAAEDLVNYVLQTIHAK